ncbi:Nn.00g017940.m01.CDS01 [Neocucurbitaria sp. VM-36]
MDSIRPSGPMTRFLIVCGAIRVDKDAWLFADFVRLVKAFGKLHELNGIFLNAFPYSEWFDVTEKMRISFGFKSESDHAPLATFERDEPPFWEQIAVDASISMADKVVDTIRDTKHVLQRNDTMNIIVIVHGSPKGDLHLGK